MIAMLRKELRENARWAAVLAGLVAVALAWTIGNDLSAGLSLVGNAVAAATVVGCPAVGLALGLLAVLPDARRGRWQFVVHRPLSRGRIFAAKATAAVALYGLATVVPLLATYAWCAAPGHVPGPVTADLLAPRLADAVSGLVWVAAGVLVATRQARWFGSRLIPLGAAFLVTLLADLLTMTFAEYAAVAVFGTVVLGTAARSAFVNGGDVPRRAYAARAAVGLSLAVGWTLAVATAVGLVVGTVETLAPLPPGPGVPAYMVLDDGRVAVIDGRGGLTDPAGKPVVVPGYPADRHTLPAAVLVPADPQGTSRPGRAIRWRFHAATSHLWALNVGVVGDVAWFYVAADHTVRGYDRTTRRPVGCLGPDGFSTGPRPFPGPLDQIGWQTYSDGLLFGRLLVADGRTVWELDPTHRQVRRVFTADAGDAVVATGRFGDLLPHHAPGPYGAVIDNIVVMTDAAVYVARDGGPAVRVAEPWRGATDFMAEVGRTTDDRLVLFYTPRPTGGAARPRRVVYATADGRVTDTADVPELAFTPPAGPRAERYVLGIAAPPALVAAIGLLGGGGPPFSTAPVWATAAAVAICSAAVTVPLARRRWYSAPVVAAWTAANLALGLPGVLLLLSMDAAEPTVPCPACGRRRPVSSDQCPRCAAGFPAPPRLGIEVFAAA